jgi:hypothetical protein
MPLLEVSSLPGFCVVLPSFATRLILKLALFGHTGASQKLVARVAAFLPYPLTRFIESIPPAEVRFFAVVFNTTREDLFQC